MSGADLPDGTAVPQGRGRLGAPLGDRPRRRVPTGVLTEVAGIATSGGTPLVVASRQPGEPPRVLGVIHLKDVVKPGMKERFAAAARAWASAPS